MTSPHMLSGIQYDVTMTQLSKEVLFEQDVPVKVAGDCILRVNVFRPKHVGRYPVIMAISPYGKDNFEGIKTFETVPGSHIGHIQISDHVAFEAPDPEYWVPNGYVVIQADVRGQGTSEGLTSMFGATEQQDYQTLIAWAAAQDWCNGNVGLNGVSYLAITQWLVAQHRPPALKAIIPWEGFNDFYLRNYFGGIPEVGFMQWVFSDWVIPNHNPEAGYEPTEQSQTPSEHPLKDEFWATLSPALERINAPALVCGSFSDQGLHSKDSIDGFVRISSSQKWLYSHRQPKWHAYYSEKSLTLQRRFLDKFLKGLEHSMDEVPLVQIEINSEREKYRLHTANTWPLEDTVYVPLYLDAKGLKEESDRRSQKITYATHAEGRITFDWCFDRDTDVVGHTKLKLWVEAIGADDMDLFVGMSKFDEAGEEVFFYGFGGTNPNDIVSRGWLRASHRELDVEKTTPWQPVHTHRRIQKLRAGEIVPVEIELMPSATSYRRGETLKLIVQANPIQPDAVLLKFLPENAGQHAIHFGGSYDSHLLLPVLPAR